MNKNKIKFVTDIIIFINFLLITISGFILWFVLPRGSGKIGNSFIFLREIWLSMHNLGSVLLVILIIIHLILNWTWIKSMFRSMFVGKRN